MWNFQSLESSFSRGSTQSCFDIYSNPAKPLHTFYFWDEIQKSMEESIQPTTHYAFLVWALLFPSLKTLLNITQFKRSFSLLLCLFKFYQFYMIQHSTMCGLNSSSEYSLFLHMCVAFMFYIFTEPYYIAFYYLFLNHTYLISLRKLISNPSYGKLV